jgi:tight adherence protein C
MALAILFFAVFIGSISFIAVKVKHDILQDSVKFDSVVAKHIHKRPLVLSSLTAVGLSIYEFFTYKRVWVVLIGCLAVLIIPKSIKRQEAARKRRTILKELPHAIEMLALMADAGLNIPEAIKYVIRHEEGMVAGLLEHVSMEIEAGSSRALALKRMAKDSGVEEMRFLVKVLLQAEEYGKPIKHILLDMARTIRLRQRYDIAARANKLPTLMLLPIFIFIIPPVLLLYMLPAILNVKQLF